MRRRFVALVSFLFGSISLAAQTVTVTPTNLQGWQLTASSGTGNAPPPAAYLATGFETPPLGTGSVHLAVGQDGNDAAQARNTNYAGTLLSNITSLSYDTFTEVDGSGGQAPYLILNVDTTGDGAADDQLFFEPVYQTGSYPGDAVPNQGVLTPGTWQTWNALAGGWWSLNAMTFGPPLVTLSTYASANPTATIVNTGSGLGGVRIITGLGAGAWNDYLGAADNFTIGVSGSTTTYDFEAAAASLVTVTTADLDGWTLQTTDDGDATNTATIAIVTGPATPPMGDGSLELSVGADGGDAAQARNSTFDGQFLRDLSSLTYSTYVDQDGSGGQAPYILLNVDYDNDGTTDDFLFFEPVYQTAGFFPSNPQPALVLDTWQSWNARNGGWWSANNTAGAGPGTNVKPLSAILAAEPDARLATDTAGALRIVAGFGAGAWDNFLGYADALSVDFSGASTTYDFEPVPSITIEDLSLEEGNGGTTNFVFSLTLSEAVSQTVTVDYTTADGTAMAADADYTPVTTAATATFAPGTTSTTITIAVTGDMKFEPNETFFVNLTNPQFATVADSQVQGTIVNDDFQPAITVTPDPLNQSEGTTSFVFNVTLSNASSQTISVGYTTTPGSATEGTDYADNTGTVTFVENDTSETITIVVTNDNIDEAGENFFVDFGAPVNATMADPQAEGIIVDDDGPPVIGIDSVSQPENAGNMIFTVTLSNPSASTVTVDFTTNAGTATVVDDYTDATGTLTFAPGDVSETITVPITDDNISEADETFTVDLAAPTNATVGTGQGTGTIQNDDGVPAISIDSVSQLENAGNMVFTVTLSNPSSSTVTVDFTTNPVSAIEGTDYSDATGTLTFAPGDVSETITVPITDDNISEADETFTVDLAAPTNATIGTGQGTGTIQNDDGVPAISIDSVSQLENAGNMVFTITLSNPSSSSVTVDFTTNPVSAIEGTDYADATGTLTFLAGDVSETVTVPITDDIISEADETFTVDLAAPANATIGTGQGTGTIQNDDGVPAISIDSVSQLENAGNMVFTVTLSNPSSSTVTVDFTTNPVSAIEGTDYSDATGTLTFAPGDVSETVTVTVIDDNISEADETFTVDLSAPVNATIGTSQGIGTIQNDDGVPAISIDSVSQLENAGNMVFTVTLSNPSSSTITVDFTTNPVSATEAADYSDATGTLTFAPGDVSETVTVPITDDNISEADETFTVDLSAPANATIGTGQGTGTIQNDDGVPAISIDSVSQLENAGNMVFTVTLSNPSSSTVTVDFTTNPVSAIEGTDYSDATGTLTFLAGDVSETITVTVIDDNVTEADETFTVDLSAPTNATVGTGQGTGTIQNDDAAPQLNIDDVAQAESSGTFVFTVTLTNPSASTITVDFTTNELSATEGVDYSDATGTLTFGPGDVSETVTVTITDDAVTEPDETFTVDLSAPTNATVGDGEGLGTVQNDEGVPTISIDSIMQAENAGSMVFTVTLSNASASTVTVSYTTNAVTATEGLDYSDATGTLTFVAGDQSETMTVPIIDDATAESDETFTVDLSLPTNAAITDGQGLGTITNDDATPLISIADITQAENLGSMTFNVTLSNPSASPIMVNFTTNPVTATEASDYADASGTLTFLPGDVSETITVPVIDDNVTEADETFTVDLSGATNATVSDPQAAGTIIDDDSAPTVTIDDVSQAENAGTMSFTVTLSNPSASTITVNYTTTGVTATEGLDYTDATGTLTFVPGDVSETITVAIVDDAADEADETFTVDLSGPTNATIGDAQGLGTIQDDDGAPVISIGDATETENAGTMTFTVTLSNPSASAVTVDYTTTGVTATEGVDYTDATGTLTFVTGDVSETITVAIIDDAADEADETFTVDLSAATNATVGDSQGLGTIVDDDGQPSVSISDVSQAEGDAGTTTFDFTVTLSNPSATPVSVDFATADGTATAPGDYVAESGTLVISGGVTGTISITVNGDTAFEPTETFFVNLTGATGGIITDDQGQGTITNDDGAMADLSITKTGPATAGLQQEIIYDITVTNAGPDTASNVVVTDTLPSGVTLVSATPSAGSCTGTTTIVCTLGMLATDGTATVTLRVRTPPSEGTISNTASVTNTPEGDPTPGNNFSAPAATVVGVTATVDVPTASEWALLLLAMALLSFALLKLR